VKNRDPTHNDKWDFCCIQHACNGFNGAFFQGE
jgi:hypothetical protein